MAATLSVNKVATARHSNVLCLAFIVAGLAGNYFNYEIFPSINFLFGSIFAMLALQFLGLGRGVVSALIISSYTFVLWNHPYAIVTMTAEMAVAGWLFTRGKMDLVLADTVYWLCIGMPLIYLIYHFAMQVPLGTVRILMVKQSLNAIADTLTARLLFTSLALRRRAGPLSLREVMTNLLAFFVLLTALVTLAVESESDKAAMEQDIRHALHENDRNLRESLEDWIHDRTAPIVNLASMAAGSSPRQMQPRLEQELASEPNFLRIALLNKQAVVIANAPPTDELGRGTIGLSYAERPYIPRMKRTLKPMLSEVVMGKVGVPKPIVAVLAPVVSRGEYAGYAIGILDFKRIERILRVSVEEEGALYTLLDRTGAIIATNRKDQKVMTPLARGKGTLKRLDGSVSQWIPVVASDPLGMERLHGSSYLAQSTIGAHSEWKLIVEQPVAPFLDSLYKHYAASLTLLFLILLAALAMAEIVSRRASAALDELRHISSGLTEKISTDAEIVWPESVLLEVNHLIGNFGEIADSLSNKFKEISRLNESLEERVGERTRELRQSEAQLKEAQQLAHVGSWSWVVDHDTATWSEELFRIFGMAIHGSLVGHANEPAAYTPESLSRLDIAFRRVLATGEPYEIELEIIRLDGEHRWGIAHCEATKDDSGRVVRLNGTFQDITERRVSERKMAEKQSELVELYKSLEQRVSDAVLDLRRKDQMMILQSRQAAMGEMIGNVAHQWRQPLNLLGLTVQELVLMQRNNTLTKEYLEASVNKTMTMISNMSKTIDDFRNFFKPDKGKVLFLVQEAVAKALALIEPSIKTMGIRVDIKGTNDPVINGYPNEYGQVLINIISNARDAFETRSADRERVITIRYFNENGRSVLIIADNAGGIPENVIDKIFEPYFTTKGPDQGTGLGLYMSKTIIEKSMGGTLKVRNIRDGAEFRIEL